MIIPLSTYVNWDFIQACSLYAYVLIAIVTSAVYFGYFNRAARRKREAEWKRLDIWREELRLKSIKIDKEYKELFGDKEVF